MCGACGQLPGGYKHQEIQLIPHSPSGPGLDRIHIYLLIHPSRDSFIHFFSMPNVDQVQGTQEESPLHSQSGGRGKNRHNDSMLEIGTITHRSPELWVTQGGNYKYLREEGESGRLPR